MTKKRFLSRRLACLLTTALIAAPIFLINTKSANAVGVTVAKDATVIAATENISGADVTISAFDGDTTVTFDMGTENSAPISIATLTFTAGTAPSVTVDDGTLTITGNITGVNLTGTVAHTIILLDDGRLALGGSTILDNASDPINITLADGSILDFTGTDKTQAATINGSAQDKGTINVTGTQTFNGAIGASGGATGVLLLNIDAASTFSSTVKALSITVDANTTFSGAITAGTAVTLGTTGTEVTFGSTVSTPILTIGANTTANLNGVVTATNTTNSLVVTGTANINAKKKPD
jgi:hypothetical protein